MASELILIVDDEASIVDLARLYLEKEGYKVWAIDDGLRALEKIPVLKPALVVLDIMLPGVDGFEVCRRLRVDNPVPILMVTARDDDIDKIIGLEMGADDYLTKPFNPRELVARVKAILRRSELRSSQEEAPIHFNDLTLDPARREVYCNGQPVELRVQEFEVLYVLMKYKGKVMTRERLLSLAWGYDFLGQTRTVDVHIAQLRKKLSASAVQIETVTGIGYKLVG